MGVDNLIICELLCKIMSFCELLYTIILSFCMKLNFVLGWGHSQNEGPNK
jgi:hypothetical protein